ncbi:LLM class F420-dependent oxidoreductase [Actinomadura rubrobrunea]|uniref:LLM class F420-dependent oxidoreductase n=1 Tax=Actinomadura rubrobrunea TaxID=115335 RepID=A0A9W6PRR6_9ACTN|nr:LLM class flavin-dependent oxidoreductase [Actinomadura rubrobrunea]GLW62242.1 LLM class F420-dependent oxidoreductase [Actinomadura rubrobrunea]
MERLKVGVGLSSADPRLIPQARLAEEAGLESVWTGDHLIAVKPFLDSTLRLAAAAAATERIKLGFGVMVLALRPVAWAAKQIATLQHLSGGRVLLGVGAGGAVHGDAAWKAVGVPYAERGRRTDAALEVLPDLVEGRPAIVNGEQVTLEPGAPMPPLLIGGGLGKGTTRRLLRFGGEWYAGFPTPGALKDAAARLAELAAEQGRPAPKLTASVSIGLGGLPASVVDAQVRGLMQYGMPEEAARNALAVGSPAQAAERVAALAEAGAHRVIGLPFGGDPLRQIELLGETARLLAA